MGPFKARRRDIEWHSPDLLKPNPSAIGHGLRRLSEDARRDPSYRIGRLNPRDRVGARMGRSHGYSRGAATASKLPGAASIGLNSGWNHLCAIRVGTTALPITAVTRMVY
jgi:hypothetical protein